MYLIFWALLIFTAGLRQADGCGTNNVYCVTNTTYQYCFVSGSTTTYVPASSTLSCSSSHVCSETASTSCVAVSSENTTSTTTTTTAATTTTTAATTTTTASTTTEAEAETSTSGEESSVTTTEVAVTPPDSCTCACKYAAQNCSQYYECVSILFFWYDLELKACSSGQAFSVADSACVTNSSCDAASGKFVTATDVTTATVATTTTVSTTTEPAVTAPSSCTSTGKYPAASCNQYYECSAFLWWYSLDLKTCASGTAYDAATEECVTDSSCS